MVQIGSARLNESGKTTGGKAGDQTAREVSTQAWYLHIKGWIVLRAKDPAVREKIAYAMAAACANEHIGYCQSHRTGATLAAAPYGYDPACIQQDTETDCSELVRLCCLYAGIKVPSFNTASEKTVLEKTGHFTVYTDGEHCNGPERLLRGDILVTRTKGHTVAVLSDGAAAAQERAAVPAAQPTKATKAEPAKAYNKALAGTYRTTAALHLRAGAGKSKASMTVLPKGTAVKCYGYYTVTNGARWLYVQASVQGVNKTGFCSGDYLERT